MAEEPIRVLIVDDHMVVRKGLRALLETEDDMEVVGEATTGEEAVAAARTTDADTILMDLVMPGMDGVEATRRILAERPEAHVLVLTSFGSDDKLFPAVEAGAIGYLLKDTGPEDLIRAIRQAARGSSSLTPAVARRLMNRFARDRGRPASREPLTRREVEVLKLVAHGYTNERIGSELCITEATVRTHVSNILAKLDLENRTQAALYAVHEGMLSPSETID